MAILLIKKREKKKGWSTEVLQEALDVQQLHTKKKFSLGVVFDISASKIKKIQKF